MRLRVRHKLVLLGTLGIVVVSSAFAWINLALAQRAIEEDLRTRAVVYAREIAVTLGDRTTVETGEVLQNLIARLLEIRKSVLQLDVLAFGSGGPRVVATNVPAAPLRFSQHDGEEVHRGQIVLRSVSTRSERYWEVAAPITLENAAVGAVVVKFSVERAEQLLSRIQFWALTLSAASVVLIGLLTNASIQLVVDRPIQRFMRAISMAAEDGAPRTVAMTGTDEFAVLAGHFNAMVGRIARFNEEMRTRVAEATGELDRRYQQVEQLNTLLFEMQRRLSRAERLALSGRVMAEVAHEVGTPLHSVAGHLELLRKDLPADALQGDAGRRLTIVETQVARVIEIIARLLDVTRRASGAPGPVDLERLARDTADLVRPGAVSAQVLVEVKAQGNLLPVQGRYDQLQQVMLNLLTNALDATPPGGRIDVTIARIAAGEVEIAVRDTGRGISAVDQKRIFEPFFSTKEAGRGTGLGLFITAEIVREHRGRIDSESEEGQGTTFRVVLPVATGEP